MHQARLKFFDLHTPAASRKARASFDALTAEKLDAPGPSEASALLDKAMEAAVTESQACRAQRRGLVILFFRGQGDIGSELWF